MLQLVDCNTADSACNVELMNNSFALCREKWPVHGGQLQLHQVITDAGAEVNAFNAYAKWCSDQAQVDGRQQETLDANIAHIENASACSLYCTCRDTNS